MSIAKGNAAPVTVPFFQSYAGGPVVAISPVWQKWLADLGQQVTNINNTITIISGGTTSNITTVNSFSSSSEDYHIEEPLVLFGSTGPQGPAGVSALSSFVFSSDSDSTDALTEASSTFRVDYNPTTNSHSVGDGSSSTPSLNFSSARTTGLYWSNPGIGYSVAGSSIGSMTSTGLNNMAIGATTASTGSFTTIAASSTITPSQTSGIVGTTTNNNANAGSVGEFISGTTSGTALTTAVVVNAASVSLTAGDWDVFGSVQFSAGAATLTNQVVSGLSTTSATFPAIPFYSQITLATSAGTNNSIPVPMQRFSLSATTTVYLATDALFTSGTLSATGYIGARRVR